MGTKSTPPAVAMATFKSGRDKSTENIMASGRRGCNSVSRSTGFIWKLLKCVSMSTSLSVLLSLSVHRVNATRCCNTVVTGPAANYSSAGDMDSPLGAVGAAEDDWKCDQTKLFCSSTLIFSAATNTTEIRRGCGLPKDWPKQSDLGIDPRITPLANKTIWCKHERFLDARGTGMLLFAYRCRCSGALCNEVDVGKLLADERQKAEQKEQEMNNGPGLHLSKQQNTSVISIHPSQAHQNQQGASTYTTEPGENNIGQETNSTMDPNGTGYSNQTTAPLQCCNDAETSTFASLVADSGQCQSLITCYDACLVTITRSSQAWRHCGTIPDPLGTDTSRFVTYNGRVLSCTWQPASASEPPNSDKVICYCNSGDLCNAMGGGGSIRQIELIFGSGGMVTPSTSTESTIAMGDGAFDSKTETTVISFTVTLMTVLFGHTYFFTLPY